MLPRTQAWSSQASAEVFRPYGMDCWSRMWFLMLSFVYAAGCHMGTSLLRRKKWEWSSQWMGWEHAVRVSPAYCGLHWLGYEGRRLSLYVSLPPPSSTSFYLFLPASHEQSDLPLSVRYNPNDKILVPPRRSTAIYAACIMTYKPFFPSNSSLPEPRATSPRLRSMRQQTVTSREWNSYWISRVLQLDPGYRRSMSESLDLTVGVHLPMKDIHI